MTNYLFFFKSHNHLNLGQVDILNFENLGNIAEFHSGASETVDRCIFSLFGDKLAAADHSGNIFLWRFSRM
jgi:hypothetical protein